MLVKALRCCLHFHWRPLLIEMSSLSLPSLHRWPTSPRSSYETFWLRFCSKAQNDQIHNSILSPGIIQFCSLSAFKILNEHDKCCIFRYAVMWKHKADVRISWTWLIVTVSLICYGRNTPGLFPCFSEYQHLPVNHYLMSTGDYHLLGPLFH